MGIVWVTRGGRETLIDEDNPKRALGVVVPESPESTGSYFGRTLDVLNGSIRELSGSLVEGPFATVEEAKSAVAATVGVL